LGRPPKTKRDGIKIKPKGGGEVGPGTEHGTKSCLGVKKRSPRQQQGNRKEIRGGQKEKYFGGERIRGGMRLFEPGYKTVEAFSHRRNRRTSQKPKKKENPVAKTLWIIRLEVRYITIKKQAAKKKTSQKLR